MSIQPDPYCFLNLFPDLKETIQTRSKTTLDLAFVNESFMNPQNFHRLSTAETPEPLVLGFNSEAKSPFLMVRYIDEAKNTKAGLDPRIKSFVCARLAVVPNVGYELLLETYTHKLSEGKVVAKLTNSFYLDGGVRNLSYLSKLIRGELPGKRVD